MIDHPTLAQADELIWRGLSGNTGVEREVRSLAADIDRLEAALRAVLAAITPAAPVRERNPGGGNGDDLFAMIDAASG